MILKRLTLLGFKSFADKTEFDFDHGVTCIVGPNGCGKSNVVDAIKWVLGEQSARSLRGRQMQDMIFNGSSTRRSSGMAQVDLAFADVGGTLNLDQDEVVVSRRLYRSGESEYLLNHQACRRKDIRELFMDTGIGVDAYSVVEQGRVDLLLQANPVERRTIFEEAAGISKYNARKREALRKLDRTEQNLLRVADIIEEIEKRLRSVKLQAGRARSFKEYDTRLRELRASYTLAEYHRFTTDIQKFEKAAAGAEDECTGFRTAIDRHEAEVAKLGEQLLEVDEKVSQTDHELVNVRAEISATEERVEGASQRIGEQEQTLARSKDRMADQENDLGRLLEQLSAEETGFAELSNALDVQNGLVTSLTGDDKRLARELTQQQATLEDEKAGIVDLLRRTAQLNNEITGLDAQAESLANQKNRLSSRDAEIKRHLEDLLSKRSQIEARRAEIVALIEAETRTLDEKKAYALQVDANRSQMAEELATAKEHRSALLSRRQVLQDLEEKMEGIDRGAQEVLQARLTGQHDLSGVCGLVGELFETDVEHATVIEAALGGMAQHLIVSDSASFLRNRELLDQLAGRLHVICTDRLEPFIDGRDFSGQEGFVAYALDQVSFPEDCERLARHLLGKTVVVRELADALALAETNPAGYRFVTLAGELVEPDGRITLGPAGGGAGIISRKSELRDIDAQLEQTEGKIAALADRLNRYEAEADHLQDLLQELRTAIYEAQTARVENDAALSSVNDSIRQFTEEQPLIAGEVSSIERQLAEARQRKSSSTESLSELDSLNRQREQQVEQLQRRIDELVAERIRVTENLTAARVQAGQLAEKRLAVKAKIHALTELRATAEAAVETCRSEIVEAEGRIDQARQVIAGARQRLAELYAQRQDVESRSLSLRRRREQIREEQERLAGAVKEARSQLEQTEKRLHETQIKLQEVKVKREELVARVDEQLGINLAEQYEDYEPTEQDWSAVEAEIEELKGKIHRLGNVNLDAISELEELQQRADFLTSQRDDLAESKRQLEQLIDRLNKESIQRFTTTFELIRNHFHELFRQLFGGGKADIILEDPDDVLGSGIEIMARPPGKELQSISLLSGGEKTLTAIALLMSVFRARPCPFVILDEVDAALDEANNERFNVLVRQFLTQSQFVIITHAKRTMTIAERLYGITMQEPGISRRVSVSFEESQAEAHAVA